MERSLHHFSLKVVFEPEPEPPCGPEPTLTLTLTTDPNPDPDPNPNPNPNPKVVFDPKRNGLEETVNFPIDVGTVIAGRYRIVEYLGSGVFSRAVQCFDMRTGGMVCIKIIRSSPC